MSERDIGQEILEGIKEIKEFKKGKKKLETKEIGVTIVPRAIREKLDLSQDEFSIMLGVKVRTLQDWEQGRRKPSGPARSLLRIAEKHPEVFLAP